jgi:uncharacterized protein YkwD
VYGRYVSNPVECAVCGAETTVTDACPHCSTPVCAEHRSPATHECGVDSDGRSGWIIDLDAPQEPRERDEESWRELLTPSRAGLWLAAGTLFVLVVAVAVVSLTGPGLGDVVASATGGVNETAVERYVASETNERRVAAGLAPLAYDGALATVGRRHSEDMAARSYVGHRNPEGDRLAERYAEAGVTCPGGENIYHTPNGRLASSPGGLADHVVRSWMNSDGHREALLRERFTRQGVGVVLTADGDLYVTQEFC